MKYTREDYLANVCTHREYYSQFVSDSVKWVVRSCIGLHTLLNSKDGHFNDIPLCRWDGISGAIRSCVGGLIAQANASGGVSLSDTICVAKEAAKQLVEEQQNTTIQYSTCIHTDV